MSRRDAGMVEASARIAALEAEAARLKRALAKFGQAAAEAKARRLHPPSLVRPEFFDQALIALRASGWEPKA